MPMTSYNDLCDLHFEREPHFTAVDRILRQLPERMQSAISDQLQAPGGTAGLPTESFNQPMPYVGLYRQYFDRNGSKQWEPCEPGTELTVDLDGGYSFLVGICVERSPNAFRSGMLWIKFSVESFSEQSVEIQVCKLGGRIAIDPASDESYASAANEFVSRFLTQLRELPKQNGKPNRIGFAAD
jgi:hypothetical protein